MRASFKVGPRAIVEADGSTVKEVFERLAVLAPVLAHADRCGLCGGTRVVPNMRLPQGFTYYELACLSCGARLPLGQTKEGGVPIVFGSAVAVKRFLGASWQERALGASWERAVAGTMRRWQTARSVKRGGRRLTDHPWLQASALFRRAMCAISSSRSAMPIKYQQISS